MTHKGGKIIRGDKRKTFTEFVRDEDKRIETETANRIAAHKALVAAGHNPLRQGNCFECFRCGLSGTLDAMTGKWLGDEGLGSKEKCSGH